MPTVQAIVLDIFQEVLPNFGMDGLDIEKAIKLTNKVESFKKYRYKEVTVKSQTKEKIKTAPDLTRLSEDEFYVMSFIARHYNKTVADVVSRNRGNTLSEIRFICASTMRYIFGKSFMELGRIFGRDHSSIIHAIESHESRILLEKGYKARYIHLMTAIEQDETFSQIMQRFGYDNPYITKYEAIKDCGDNAALLKDVYAQLDVKLANLNRFVKKGKGNFTDVIKNRNKAAKKLKTEIKNLKVSLVTVEEDVSDNQLSFELGN